MKRLAVLTSGGDAPGMNAAVRAVVRKAIYDGLEVLGVDFGFQGLMAGRFRRLDAGSVGDVIHRGGTILRSARAPAFREPEGQRRALQSLREHGVDALVVIGGNGSLQGALALHRQGFPVAGIPASIDNDVGGTEASIGFDTAVNTVVEAIDRIRDTASSHERTFVIEVMGRDRGFIALAAGLAGGAESVLVPELPVDYDEICARLRRGFQRGKTHSIIVVAEGVGSAYQVAREIERRTGLETRVTVLGHIQRGGSPSAADRILATRLGAAAVECLREGHAGHLVGIRAGEVRCLPLEEALEAQPPLPGRLATLVAELAI